MTPNRVLSPGFMRTMDRRKIEHAVGLLLLLAAACGLYADVLIAGSEYVIAGAYTDLVQLYAPWREYGFGEISRGNLPLWNPYIFGGAPYIEGFQSALFYPPNMLFAVLPLATAFNVSAVMHMFLAGAFTYVWAAGRGVGAAGRVLAGLIVMFCGAHLPHQFAGHATMLCTMAWSPLVLLAVDGLFALRWRHGILIGALAVAMQVLAGFPQMLFYTGVAAAIYAGFLTIGRLVRADETLGRRIQRTAWAMGGFAAIYVGGILLSAVQFVPSWLAGSEFIRGRRLPYEVAASLSFPPENFLTLLAPGLFGCEQSDIVPYWGKWYSWETNAFVGVAGLLLTLFTLFRARSVSDGPVRSAVASYRSAWLMVAVCLVLALGDGTPLHRLLYDYVPGFDRVRSSGKFFFTASLFIALLAGAGFDRMTSTAGREPTAGDKRSIRWLALGAISSALTALAFTALLGFGQHGDGSRWHRFMLYASGTDPTTQPGPPLDFVALAARETARALTLTAGTLAAIGLILLSALRYPRLRYAVGVIAVVEVTIFGWHYRAVSPASVLVSHAVFDNIKKRCSADDRVLWPAGLDNIGMRLRTAGVWGYDAFVPTRYAEALHLSQNHNPETATMHLPFQQWHPLLRMLRCRYLVMLADESLVGARLLSDDSGLKVYEGRSPLPRVMLLEQWRLIQSREEMFRALADPAFDPAVEVLLEKPPAVSPGPVRSSPPGRAEIVSADTHALTMKVELDRPAILLVTDNYFSGWRATDESNTDYEVVPANHTLRAISLPAGARTIRMEYRPVGLNAGGWISGAALIGYLTLLAAALRPYHRRWRR
jgi:hypothetical protein